MLRPLHALHKWSIRCSSCQQCAGNDGEEQSRKHSAVPADRSWAVSTAVFLAFKRAARSQKAGLLGNGILRCYFCIKWQAL